MTIDSDAWHDAKFRKSTRSEGQNGCVEIARPRLRFGVRDSKNTGGPVLDLDAAQGFALLDAVKHDRLG